MKAEDGPASQAGCDLPIFIILTLIMSIAFGWAAFDSLPTRESAKYVSGVVLSGGYGSSKGTKWFEFQISGSRKTYKIDGFLFPELPRPASEAVPTGSSVEMLTSDGGRGLSDAETVYELRVDGNLVLNFHRYIVLESERQQGIGPLFKIFSAVFGLLCLSSIVIIFRGRRSTKS